MKKDAESVPDQRPVEFVSEDGFWRLIIQIDAAEVFLAHRQLRARDNESGGQLFGTVHEGAINIAKATGPSKNDWRSRFGFRPLRSREQRDIENMFKQGLHFLGNWHTHPEYRPTPSITDFQSISEEFLKSDHQLPFFLMAIVGLSSDPTNWWMSAHQQATYQRFSSI